jgi:hypothetical protein
MKQLKFMLAAATAISLATAAQAGTNYSGFPDNFDSATAGDAATTLTGYDFRGTAGDDESVVQAGGYDGSANALKVNTGTEPLLRAIDYSTAANAVELDKSKAEEKINSLDIDTMVQFTVTPELDTVMPGLINPELKDEDGNLVLENNIKDDKLLIYLQEKTVGETKSNVLKVWASLYTPAQSGRVEIPATFKPQEVTIANEITVQPNTWYRLQVSTKIDSDGVVYFEIMLDGTKLYTETSLYSSGGDKFPSLLGNKSTTLTYVGFAGEGLVDDLVVSRELDAPSSVDFTLALGEGVSAVKFTIGEVSYTLDAETTEMTIEDLDLNSEAEIIEVKYAEYCVPATGDLIAGSKIALNAATVSKVVKASDKLSKVEGEVTAEAAKAEYGVAETAQIFTSTSDNATEAGAEITSAQIAKILDWNNRVNGGKIADVNNMKFVAGEPDGDSAEAYLLNCSTAELAKEKEEFKFSPEDLASLMTSGLSATGLDADKQKYIGEFVLEGASALNGEATVWQDSNKWTGEEKPAFYRARLIFK